MTDHPGGWDNDHWFG